MSLDQQEAFARIRLLRSPNIGPVSYQKLLGRFGTAHAAIEALPDLARRGGKPYRAASVARIEQEVQAAKRAGARYLFHDAPDYPELLAQIEGAPPILLYRGDMALAAKPCVAVVGARNASAAAIKLAREFAHSISDAGHVVVSGLARGIDGAAHQGALPATIGVIASGIDIAYPTQHAELQEQIAEGGLLLAEQPPGTEPRGSHFPSRNRIIAGLAAGTLVVEAAPRSGSLITARLAGEAGREIMAIPGSPLDARSQGCNQLIRDGAILVQSADDVLELLSGFEGAPRSSFHDVTSQQNYNFEEAAEDTAESADIAGLLTQAPIAVDELIRQSGENVAAIQLALLELEIAGLLVRHAGGKVSLAK
ncbi:DNA-processing protein DprA [Altericroceibacterium endophyticum]|uniref:DNA-protecting protein DprA n=1 Tax=Altericroceibacterium endophyticum TaxID=1808508 RepID=A0A6I4T501_9SPHN|nr:DNA-processing protein DprA [Altericroceibacterium endophyticum]MXO64765.1 DNA-protecting protein DprA [Altericroceibacterium endophyticum]